MIFHQDQSEWKNNLVFIEISKNDSDRVVDFLIFKNHYVLIKTLLVFLRNRKKSFICRRCLNSPTSENMLKIPKPKCESFDITAIRTSSESLLLWKNHFYKNPLIFRI